MKKIITVVLALSLVLGLAACGGSSSSSAPPASGSAASSNAEPAGYKPPATVTVIVPYAAGGAVDLGTRLMAKYAAKYSDSDLVVTNVSGGGGTVGAAELLKYNADGSYMLASNPSPGFIATADKPLTFDFVRDFTFVSLLVQDQRVICVPINNGNYNNLEEFIAYAQANPKKINVGCSGTGNSAYLTPYLLGEAAGVELNIVAYDGASEAKSDLLGGHIEAISISYSEALPMVQNDQVIIIGVASAERFDKMPDVPTFLEHGYDVQMFTSRGYAMKAGTDPEAVKYWSDVIGKVCADSDFLAEAESMGFPIAYMDYEAFTAQVEKEMASYDELMELIEG